ncbi:surface-adhesin E family protein [Caulobacter sp. UNC358MFTsu5.1]|uniref:surface-adhesin E family protein n=1 Tax=Caulobacter sp. UNC358MFTsu5.1 TaxID=1449049 RepID=UPI0004A7096A|nr:surface-adhesin E family protein [Caulobacter sp. UNC358MFTsu5.1]
MITGLLATGLLAMAGPAAAAAAAADYGLVGKTDQAVMLIDRSTVKEDGHIRSARALIFSRDRRFDPKEAYTILAYQFDCSALTSKVDRILVFDEADAVISNDNTAASAFEPEKPGTLGREALSIVCGTKDYPIAKSLSLPVAKAVADAFLHPAAK